MKNSLKRLLIHDLLPSLLTALAVCFVLFASLANIIPLSDEPTVPISDNVIRLRVVANSCSEYDGQVKLAVRDALLKNAPDLFGSCQSQESAKLAVRSHLFTIEQTAIKAVRDSGSQEDVRIHFGYERAPVRRYNDYTFPADDYLTLRIDIGKADSRNWWCVLYPPLCLAAAQTDESAENGISASEQTGSEQNVALDRDVFLACGFTEQQLDALQKAAAENDKNDGKPAIRSALVSFFCKLTK